MKTLSFFQSCGARSRLTLVSQRINYPFTIQSITASFSAGCENTLQLSFFHSADKAAPTTEPPTDLSILAENSQVDYLVGDAQQKTVKHELVVDDRGSFIKVHAYNTDFFPHDADVQIAIEPNP